MNAVILILSDSRGIYILRDFICDDCNEIAWEHCESWGLTKDNAECWRDAVNPDSEYYGDAWDWILNNAEYTDENGNKYRLHHNGDLRGLCYDKMTYEEKLNFGLYE